MSPDIEFLAEKEAPVSSTVVLLRTHGNYYDLAFARGLKLPPCYLSIPRAQGVASSGTNYRTNYDNLRIRFVPPVLKSLLTSAAAALEEQVHARPPSNQPTKQLANQPPMQPTYQPTN